MYDLNSDRISTVMPPEGLPSVGLAVILKISYSLNMGDVKSSNRNVSVKQTKSYFFY
jgi:hypothetical protein